MQSVEATGDYLDALARQDRRGAVEVVTRVVAGGTPVADVIEQMLAPAQAEVGMRWQRNDWSVADEHAATAITEVALGVLALYQPAPVARPAPVCVTTAAGEWHGLAGRMVAEGLRARRWDVIYVGSDLPDDHLRRFLDRVRPAALLLSCTIAAALPQLARSLDASAQSGVPTIVGGLACGTSPHRARGAGANAWAQDTEAAHALLSRWIDEGVPAAPAQRAAVPDDYLDLIGRRGPLVARLVERADELLLATEAGAEARQGAGHIVAGLADALAASLFVDDSQLFAGYAGWLVDMLNARRVPPGATRALLDHLQSALADLPRAARFVGTSRETLSA